jgi:nucleoside-diphosphate-sugar epimerase
MFAADAAAAVGELLGSNVQGPVNICTGKPIRISSLASQIAEEVGVEKVSESTVKVKSMVVGDPSRLHQEVGYKAGRGLTEGLASTVEWWKLQG